MTLVAATLIPGILLALLGAAMLSGHPAVTAALKAFPRSSAAALVCFGGGAVWFLYEVWHLSMADFGQYRLLLFVGFAALALLAFKCVPEFLAVRGLAVLMLLAANPLLGAAYMEYAHPQRLLMVSPVYLGIGLAIYLGAMPYRLRDFIGWMLQPPRRLRVLGGILLGYGLVLVATAFTY